MTNLICVRGQTLIEGTYKIQQPEFPETEDQ